MSVEVVRKDIKNLHLAVYPPNGRVRVAIPLRLDDEPTFDRRQVLRLREKVKPGPRRREPVIVSWLDLAVTLDA